MQHSETLLTLAELGIAFAGFTGLVAVFGGARLEADARVHHVRFRGMIETALILVIFSIAPIVLSAFDLGDQTVWRVASGLLSGVWCSQIAIALRRTAALQAPFNRALSVVLLVVYLGTNAMLLSNLAGLFGHIAGAAYLLGLSSLLAVAALLFLRVLIAFVPEGGE